MHMNEPGRNEPCHCGSGKKYKNCHMGKTEGVTGNKSMLYIAVFAVILALAGFSIFYNWDKAPAARSKTNGNTLTPPPAGEAPPGKVWSAEHGHWHDI